MDVSGHGRRLLPALIGCTVAVLLAACTGGGDAAGPRASTAAATGPLAGAGAVQKRANVVLVLTDDLASSLTRYLPHVGEMARHGLTFDNYFVTDSLCCPSRASLFTGRFPHNTGIFTNNSPDGGFGVFHERGEEASTVATDLRSAGYATAMMGKYLNQYEPDRLKTGEERYVPPGWDEWDVAGSGYREFDYDLNENGTVRHYGHGKKDYLTDVLAEKGRRFVAEHAGKQPFFLEIATFSPHAPSTPAPRHEKLFPGAREPRTPAYNTEVSDAPQWLQRAYPLNSGSQHRMDANVRKRAQSMQSVDELIAGLQRQLTESGVADDTYLIFMSDNGFHFGEYRLTGGKQTPFDTDIRVPFVLTGPGVPAGVHSDAMIENVDFRPTLDVVAGVTPPAEIDGHSLFPLADLARPGWRSGVLVEHHGSGRAADDPDRQTATSGDPPTYAALRLPGSLYVEYATGERQYHDLSTDPYEVHNTAGRLSEADLSRLHAALARLTACSGSACWDAGRVAARS